MVKTILRKENKVEFLTITDFKTYYKATVVKKNYGIDMKTNIDQWNRKARSKPSQIWPNDC